MEDRRLIQFFIDGRNEPYEFNMTNTELEAALKGGMRLGSVVKDGSITKLCPFRLGKDVIEVFSMDRFIRVKF